MYVNGNVAQGLTQGNYIIAINANVNQTNVNSIWSEGPGMPTAQEGQGANPPFTHWDQRIVLGTSTTAFVNGFDYRYKLLVGSVGSSTAQFFPIILNTNNFILNTSGSVAPGVGNVLSITLPLTDLSIRPNTTSPNPPTIIKPPITQIYVNYITTDTTGTPVDQLGPNGINTVGYALSVNVTQNNTVQLPNFSTVVGPSNPNLFIIGGQITVSGCTATLCPSS